MKYPFSVNTSPDETNETLEGFIYETNEEPTCLMMHGNRETDSQKDYFYLASLFQKKKISSTLFDFSGFGSSSGKYIDSTLEKRFEEAKDISPFLNPETELIVVATGTNAINAIRLTQFYPIKTLILFAPNIPYNSKNKSKEEMQEEIKNFENTCTFLEEIQSFQGKLLIIKGKNDRIADKPVTNFFINNFQKTYQKELLVIPNADHTIHNFLKNNTEAFKLMTSKIDKLL